MPGPTRRFTGSPAVPFQRVFDRLGGDASERALREAAGRFPVRFTEYYLDRADPGDPGDPVRRIAMPDASELVRQSGELDDPVGERGKQPVPFVVRKHRDRAVFLVTSRCHVYCRFCFRRSFPDGEHDDPTPRELDDAVEYLTRDPRLEEVILSGGDPLALPDAVLADLIARLSAGDPDESERPANARPASDVARRAPRRVDADDARGRGGLRRLRIHTRAPVHDPARVTPELARTLASGLPMRVVTHFNHPNERTDETRRALDTLREAGLPLANQTVLLRGVNDDAETLERLFRGLLDDGVTPYYLHHPDRVAGAGSFYVSIERGLAIHEELRCRLDGGLALPRYVIDPPDGSGKVEVVRYAHAAGLRRNAEIE